MCRLKLERNRDPCCLSLKRETSIQPVQVQTITSLTSDHCTNEIMISDHVQIVRLILRYIIRTRLKYVWHSGSVGSGPKMFVLNRPTNLSLDCERSCKFTYLRTCRLTRNLFHRLNVTIHLEFYIIFNVAQKSTEHSLFLRWNKRFRLAQIRVLWLRVPSLNVIELQLRHFENRIASKIAYLFKDCCKYCFRFIIPSGTTSVQPLIEVIPTILNFLNYI